MSYRWVWLALLGATLLLGGCASVSRFEKGQTVAFGQKLDDRPQPLYYLIRLDPEHQADQPLPHFRVKLGPQAEPTRLSALTPAYVARYLPPFKIPDPWPETWKRRARIYQAYEGGGFYVSFKAGRLAYLGLCSHCSGEHHAPIICNAAGDYCRALPLTKEQMRRIIGRPDRVRQVREVTY